MKRFLMVLLVSLLGVPFACCDQHATPTASRGDVQADIAAINSLMQEFVRLYNAGDFAGLMSVFYTDDPVLMSPGVPARKGKGAILRSYLKDNEANMEHIDRSAVEDVRVSDGLAVARGRDVGTTTPRGGGKPVPYDLKWVLAFERQPDGTWKCLYEIWNDNPAAGR